MKEHYGFEVFTYKKSELIGDPVQISFTTTRADLEDALLKLYRDTKEHLETLVINKGLITTFSGIFCLIKPVTHDTLNPIIIVYRPTFNYDVITNKAAIFSFFNQVKAKVAI